MTPEQIKALAKQAGGAVFTDPNHPAETGAAFGPIEFAEFVLLVRESDRAVMALALTVLESIPASDSDCDEQTQSGDDAIQELITAIKERLK